MRLGFFVIAAVVVVVAVAREKVVFIVDATQSGGSGLETLTFLPGMVVTTSFSGVMGFVLLKATRRSSTPVLRAARAARI